MDNASDNSASNIKTADRKPADTPQEALPQGQVPDYTLAAGELLSLKCPSASNPSIKEGDIFPEAGSKSKYKILKIIDSVVTLGFFQGGAL